MVPIKIKNVPAAPQANVNADSVQYTALSHQVELLARQVSQLQLENQKLKQQQQNNQFSPLQLQQLNTLIAEAVSAALSATIGTGRLVKSSDPPALLAPDPSSANVSAVKSDTVLGASNINGKDGSGGGDAAQVVPSLQVSSNPQSDVPVSHISQQLSEMSIEGDEKEEKYGSEGIPLPPASRGSDLVPEENPPRMTTRSHARVKGNEKLKNAGEKEHT